MKGLGVVHLGGASPYNTLLSTPPGSETILLSYI